MAAVTDQPHTRQTSILRARQAGSPRPRAGPVSGAASRFPDALAESLRGGRARSPQGPLCKGSETSPFPKTLPANPALLGLGVPTHEFGDSDIRSVTCCPRPQSKAFTGAEYTHSAPGAPKSEFPQHPAEIVGSKLPSRTPGSRSCPVPFPRLWGPVMGATAVTVHTARRGKCVPLTPGCLRQERKQLLQTRDCPDGNPRRPGHVHQPPLCASERRGVWCVSLFCFSRLGAPEGVNPGAHPLCPVSEAPVTVLETRRCS